MEGALFVFGGVLVLVAAASADLHVAQLENIPETDGSTEEIDR